MSDPRQIVEQLQAIYAGSVENLRAALRRYLDGGAPPNPDARADGAFAYPELRLIYRPDGPGPRITRSFARLVEAGTYVTTVTRPELFADYLIEQLELLSADYGVTVEAGLSRQEIPFPYVLDGADLGLDAAVSAELARYFPATELAFIGDEVADGLWDASGERPLSLFDGLRTDFSLARLKHYTGTPPEHSQNYILFTNYHRYVDEFVRWGCDQLRAGGMYTALSGAGGVYITPETADPMRAISESAWRKHQMPAYHLMAPGKRGITLVNIGVGPSNAKTITDHLAVLRPEAWLMIGHCGGLRPSQTIGDYVLAHAYLRDDHVLDAVLPPEIPIPAIAEVQVALQKGAERVSGEQLDTLLCVSDKPLHGEIKLPGQANRFYEQAISEHMMIGVFAVEELRAAGPALHSRKLRAFAEPPFR